MSESKQFIYQDQHGNITARTVENISETDEYIQGICLRANSLRTFRLDRVIEFVSSSNIEERLAFHLKHTPPPKPQGTPTRTKSPTTRKNNSEGQLEIHFTGFKKPDKELLMDSAEQSGFFIRSSVTANLNFLCCGYNASPNKIEDARRQGVVVLSENQFKELLKTGEIPEE